MAKKTAAEERVETCIRMSEGTMPIQIVCKTKQEFEEVTAALKHKRNAKLITVKLEEAERGERPGQKEHAPGQDLLATPLKPTS